MQCMWHGCPNAFDDAWAEWYPYCHQHMAWKQKMLGHEFVPFVTPKLVLEVSKVTLRHQAQRQAKAVRKEKGRAMRKAMDLEDKARFESRSKDYEAARSDGELAVLWGTTRQAVVRWRKYHGLPAKRRRGEKLP